MVEDSRINRKYLINVGMLHTYMQPWRLRSQKCRGRQRIIKKIENQSEPSKQQLASNKSQVTSHQSQVGLASYKRVRIIRERRGEGLMSHES